ncbi:MAG: beta-ketoacyl-ACP reductase [Holosporaceae bacterium]|jgi:acetoacetyl-CoA reductase|nr:beta-ketoacyl-ACP reductase [Holosporaceae bacterium]
MKKIALVTGGTRGIGSAISRALNDAGYLVAANYQSGVENAEKFRDETKISAFSWDVSDYKSCESGIKEVCRVLGGTIDILVNNAGVTRDCMLHKMRLEDWTKVITTNLNSVFNMCRLVIQSMREKNFGRIVNISSVNGLKGQVGQSNYSAAKAGIIGFTKALALESASKGITVNAIAPGYISTNMTEAIPDDIKENIRKGIPVGRFGCVDEVANSVLFLVDEKSSFITGTVLNVNGGQYL